MPLLPRTGQLAHAAMIAAAGVPGDDDHDDHDRSDQRGQNEWPDASHSAMVGADPRHGSATARTQRWSWRRRGENVIVSDLFGDAVGDAIRLSIGESLRRRRADRQLANSRVECSLRVVSGEQAGLTHRWRSGTAELMEGCMSFRRRLPPGGPVTVEVVAVSRGNQRQPHGGESWFAVSGQCRIVEVTTPTAVLEWAVLDRHLHWAIERVSKPRRTAR